MIDVIFLSKIENLIHQPVHIITEDGIKRVRAKSDHSNTILIDELQNKLGKMTFHSVYPFIYIDEDGIFYGVYIWGGCKVVLGPFYKGKNMEKRIQAEKIEIQRFEIELLANILTLILYEATGEDISSEDIAIVSEGMLQKVELWDSGEGLELYQLNQSEFGREHTGGIEFENVLQQIVKSGDVAAMRQLLNGYLPNMSDITELAKSDLKRMEYVIVAMITMITRAAVEGGMNPEEAYELGDVYMRKLEQNLGNISAMKQIGISAQLDFTEKVCISKNKRSQNIYIEKCKDYVAKNLRKDIKVGDIASNIGVSKGYLSHRFSEVEGLTIQQYITKEKCRHAANLLKYSDYSISLIAEYFGFSSQSHLGTHFKKIYGMTPNEYRTHYKR